MLRKGLLALGDSRLVKRVVTGTPVTRRMSRRFVAGETVDDAVEATRQANAEGLRVTLNYLGEFVAERRVAAAARDTYVRLLQQVAREDLQAGISVKLTQLGQGFDDDLLAENLEALLDAARQEGVFVRFDMESSDLVQPTLDLFEKLWAQGRRGIGVVLQSYLKRTSNDVRRMIELGAPVRLCKGAYSESGHVAYQDMDRIRAAFREQMGLLLPAGVPTAIATHDPLLLDSARGIARDEEVDRDVFEFQQLYGVRRDLQEELRAEGYNVRVYIPFGEMWYPYLMRRLAERPENLAFMVGSVVRDSPFGRLLPQERRGRSADGSGGGSGGSGRRGERTARSGESKSGTDPGSAQGSAPRDD